MMDIPDVPARMIVVDGYLLYWQIRNCPLCGGRHRHGIGADPRAPGWKFPHCIGLRDEQTAYLLVDEDPLRTERILAAIAKRPPGRLNRRAIFGTRL
jgi:hypothetical protein